MKTIKRKPEESIESLAERIYVLRGADGKVITEKLDTAIQALQKANPNLDDHTKDVKTPELDQIPYLKEFIKDPRQLHIVIHRHLSQIEKDERLHQLSFIDPLRLAVEELGITFTPEIAYLVREMLEGVLSFNPKEYAAIRDGKKRLGGSKNIRWVHKLEEDRK